MPAWLIVPAGIVLLALLAFQIAVGKRWIRFGKKNLKVHNWAAWAMLVLALLHGLGGLAYVGLIKLP